MCKSYSSAVLIVWIAFLCLQQAHADQKPITEKYETALEYCSVYAQGTFIRALERKHFKTSARHHAAISPDKPGEGNARAKHEMIELVHAFPDQKPHELAVLGYARCINKFADSFWDYDNVAHQQ